jgi:cell wall assembly regulator SMI1
MQDLQKDIRTLLNQFDAAAVGIGAAELDELLGRHGVSFPPSLRAWLAMCNGSFAAQGGLLGVGRTEANLDIFHAWAIYPEWKRLGWIPVAADGCGNYYVVVPRGPNGEFACFIDTAESPFALCYAVASDALHLAYFMLHRECHRSGWPFDEAWVTSVDPRIIHCDCAPMPWELD